MTECNSPLHITFVTLFPEAIETMMRYRWPGNVRELQNLVERLLVLSSPGPIAVAELPTALAEQRPAEDQNARQEVLIGEKTLSDAVDEFERGLIQEALHQAEFNQTRAAEILGTTRRILKYRMDKLEIAERR